MIPKNVYAVVIDQADAFYEGKVSSVEAFRVINAAARSAWNYYDGIFNDTHAAFATRVDCRIEADIAGWTQH